MAALRKAEKQDDEHVVTISKHKTGHITPVTLFFSPELWRYLSIFTTMMRRRLPGYSSELVREESAVFVTYPMGPSGHPGPMTTSLVNKSVHSIWKAAGVKKKLSVTNLRKAAPTKVRSKFPWARHALAQQMTHRASTQDQYYLLKQKKQECAKIVKLIEKCMTEDEVHTDAFYFTRFNLSVKL
ncbi:uncharacterized protein [Magallana gigas]|uniref:uncharacterized protein n=1 Tax=Magallana gigas TaxID=29159 RepID=UPI00333F6F09